jgi:hypothetical protein
LRLKALAKLPNAPAGNAVPLEIGGTVLPVAANSRLSFSDIDIQLEGIPQTPGMTALATDLMSRFLDPSRIRIKRHKMQLVFHRAAIHNHAWHVDVTATVRPDDKTLKTLFSRNSR